MTDIFSLDPTQGGFLPSVELLLKLVAGAGGLYLFLKGFRRYKKDQAWKVNEFVAKEMKDFQADPMVRNVMYILDWGARYIELFPGKPNYEDRFAKVDREILKSALQYHVYKITTPGSGRFSQTEVAIRDNFDCFFSYFERFEHFIEAGLITTVELEPYLRYWVNAISEDIEPDVRNFIYHYIHIYQYKGAVTLFNRFNRDITPNSNIETTREIMA